ncbi:hypothetical protein RFI_16189, partial [Reticulomyxa filosa]
AVRTGGPGIFGISLLLIERGPGVTTTRLPLQGHDTSATAYIIFKNVRVPKANIIGVENQGFLPIMHNFNNERFGIIATAISLAKVCVDESIAMHEQERHLVCFYYMNIIFNVWTKKLLTKKKKKKLRSIFDSTSILAVHCLMEWCAYRLNQTPFGSSDNALIKDLGLLKVQATQCVEYCAREARQIFGGRAYIRGGRAAKVERVYRDVSALAIYGYAQHLNFNM